MHVLVADLNAIIGTIGSNGVGHWTSLDGREQFVHEVVTFVPTD
jgi:ABC-type methionine transport system permease subunit